MPFERIPDVPMEVFMFYIAYPPRITRFVAQDEQPSNPFYDPRYSAAQYIEMTVSAIQVRDARRPARHSSHS